ncbi:unnamed protein product [Polarella glacialis]|uniref:Cytochrome b5 heme-binding domain-containing protein n=1 Tax=Polarella glacialis TaxID=89957 RepID=A0A813JIN8_POLGL|nr:unnamed protein product [Polarella glacialis]
MSVLQIIVYCDQPRQVSLVSISINLTSTMHSCRLVLRRSSFAQRFLRSPPKSLLLSEEIVSKMSVTAEEVAKHSKDTDCWVIVGEQVLDVTNFLEDHPGGKKSIMMFAGRDATEEFDMLHDRKVIKKYGLDEGTVVLKGTIKK